jgi:predicted RNA-binding Zn ribbon-like protein
METTEFLGGDLALNFVDTVGGLLSTGPLPEDELLRSYEDLALFAVDQGLVTHALAQRLRRRARANPGEAEAALATVLERRALLDAVFRPLAAGDRPDAAALDELGAFAAEALTRGRLVRDGSEFRWTWDDAADLLTPLWPVAHAAVELLGHGPLDRIKGCGRCRWLFLDTTKNNSRRWCSAVDCGKDEKMERYVARRRERRRSGGTRA